MKTNRLSGGFSMLEFMVALAMAAVLAAYAVPSYLAYKARGHRINAVVALHRAAQYVTAHASTGNSVLGPALALPAGLSRIPEYGHAVYRLELSLVGQQASGGYELRAIPVDEGPMRDDACGTFLLNGLGLRANLGSTTGGASVERCWSGRAA